MQPLLILFGSAFTLAVCYSLGSRLLGAAASDAGLRVVSGAALLSTAVFACCACGLVYTAVFLALGAAALTISRPGVLPRTFVDMIRKRSPALAAGSAILSRHSQSAASSAGSGTLVHHPEPIAAGTLRHTPEPALRARDSSLAEDSRPLALLRSRWCLLFAPYLILYLSNAMAPEISFDGSRYHLGLVGRYLREHGFHPIRDNFYAAFSQGVEMLYLFAYAFGRHSSAAVVHFGLLLALVWQMLSWSRRAGYPLAGLCAAALILLSPIVGVDGASAYNDVAVAAIAFSLFHLLQISAESHSRRLLIAIGLAAGFAYAAKYTAFLAVPYAIAWIGWNRRSWRDAAIVVFFVAAMILPWMFKDWLWYRNPVAPFFNRYFPNQYVTVSFEGEYLHQLSHPQVLASLWQLPIQATTFGSLSGLLGPVFLLVPLALLSLRDSAGRQLLIAAAVFGAPFVFNVSTRFLIPAIPFVALALCLVLARIPRIAVAAVVIHALLSWPTVVRRYCHPDAWRLDKVTWREALRIKPEDGFLESNLPLYGAARLLDRVTPPDATIFTQTPIPEAYTSRHVRTAYQSAANIMSRKVFWSGFVPEHAPVWRLRFQFPKAKLAAIRIVQMAAGSGSWSIHEIRAFNEGREVPRSGWRATARPFPWGAAAMLDGRLASFWLCGETLRRGEYVQIDFPGRPAVDSVLVEAAPDQPGIRLRLEGRVDNGWMQLADRPEIGTEPIPPGIRRAAAEELRRRGNDYLLAFDGEFGADDLRQHAADWGIRQTGEYKGARVYRLP